MKKILYNIWLTFSPCYICKVIICYTCNLIMARHFVFEFFMVFKYCCHWLDLKDLEGVEIRSLKHCYTKIAWAMWTNMDFVGANILTTLFPLVLVGTWATLALQWSSHAVQWPNITKILLLCLRLTQGSPTNLAILEQPFRTTALVREPIHGWISGIPTGRLQKVEWAHSKQEFVEISQILGQRLLFYHGWNYLCFLVLRMETHRHRDCTQTSQKIQQLFEVQPPSAL